MSRQSPLSPQVVAEIRSSTETGGAIARRLGVAKWTVNKIRAGKSHVGIEVKPSPEDLVRRVLSQPPDLSLAQISKIVGLERDAVRRIRLGLAHADVLPDLPRMTLEESERRCWRCIQWDGPFGSGGSDRWGRCNLGIPEATQSQTWARGCGAYMPADAP